MPDTERRDSHHLPRLHRWPHLGSRAVVAIVALLLAGVIAATLSTLNLDRIGNALISAKPEWVALALALMMAALLTRSVSWRQTLRAALPGTRIGQLAVTRATMIGVMGSAVFPGRLGEPSRVLIIARRLPASTRRMLPVVAGTVFSQTIFNIFALAILAAITFTSVPLLHGSPDGLIAVTAIPVAIVAAVVAGPALLRSAQRSRSARVRGMATALIRLLHLAAQGLRVFARPRHGVPAVAAQLLAWALQWASCYVVLVALDLQSHAGLDAAAAVLLAVNVTAILPATPSNVGVFQAACLVVLAAYGVAAGPALAYGIILQAVEIVTALLLGMPALLGEGMTWQEMRAGGQIEEGE